ncbi:MAG: hypothetical protein FJX52_06150, partial [Alphaproteobacteria bacterium]|nr:hypothetical protein [Alphaproteobacteria bacterium]
AMQEVVDDAFRAEHGTGDTLIAIRRQAHNLKGMGSSFGFPAISMVAHRLEDYLVDLGALSPHELHDAQQFLDALQFIVRRGIDPNEEELGELVRALPVKGGFDMREVVQTDVEVLLVA